MRMSRASWRRLRVESRPFPRAWRANCLRCVEKRPKRGGLGLEVAPAPLAMGSTPKRSLFKGLLRLSRVRWQHLSSSLRLWEKSAKGVGEVEAAAEELLASGALDFRV